VAQDENGFEVGRARDASFSLADAAPFEPLLRLPEVRPLECPAESAAAACLTEATNGWLATCNVLQAQCSLDAAGAAPGEMTPGSSGAGGTTASVPRVDAASGTGGVSSPANAAGAGGASGPSSSGDSPGPLDGGSGAKSGSCSSVALPAGTASARASAWWLVALLFFAARRRTPRRSADALLVALLPLGASSLSACSDDSTLDAESSGAGNGVEGGAGPDAAPSDCGGAGEAFALGMSKATPDGGLTVAIVAAEPAPPLVGPNAWTITAADVTFTGWMPQHGHGLGSVPLAEELEDGRYEIRPINLFMPQLWEFGVGVTQADERDAVTFSFCVR
jgi:hypothetical protein